MQPFPEGVVEDVLRLSTEPIERRAHVHLAVHRADGGGGGARLGFRHVPRPEEELAVEVGLLDGVGVGHRDLALGSSGDAHHRPVLEHLAADGTRAHEQVPQRRQLLLQRPAEHRRLRVVARAARRRVRGGQQLAPAGEHLFGIEVEPLHHRHELARRRLHHLLRGDAAKEGGERRELPPRAARKGCEQPLRELDLGARRLGETLGAQQHLCSGGGVGRRGQRASLGAVRVERLETKVQLHRPVELGKIREQELGAAERLRERFERHCFLLLHLVHVAATDVLAVAARVLDGESVRAEDLHRVRRLAVELAHADHLGEGDLVAVLEAMPRVVEHGDDAGRLLRDGRNHRRERLLARGVVHDEGVAKVAEETAEDAKRVAHDEARARRAASLVDRDGLAQRRVGHHDDAKLADQLSRQLARDFFDRHILVELGEARQSDRSARLADVRLSEEELRREVGESDGRWVV
mmetsp:Transcript_22935/g.52953  ORF Transcript_22935/g.52953 Transcript_22935/m.52953 type:complete len:466 (-) Transcript_22935:264-1661(-)